MDALRKKNFVPEYCAAVATGDKSRHKGVEDHCPYDLDRRNFNQDHDIGNRLTLTFRCRGMNTTTDNGDRVEEKIPSCNHRNPLYVDRRPGR